MEYYPLKDISAEQYWKLKVTNGRLHLEENTEAESDPNPIINDKDGTTWQLLVDSGRLALADTVPQPDTQFYLRDPAGNTWRVIADHGVIGIEKGHGKAQPVLKLSHHPLDVRSDGWVDLSGFGNHGTPYGGVRPVMICPGVIGYRFDGKSGYIKVLDNAGLSATGAVTVQFWIYPNRFQVLKPVGKTITYEFWMNENKFYFGVYEDDATYHGSGYSVAAISPGTWGCVTGVYNPDLVGGNVQIWIGDVKENEGDYTGGVNNSVNSLNIGGNVSTWQEVWFDGVIAQPVVENRAWSPDEVRENHYRSLMYRMLRGLPKSFVYVKVPYNHQVNRLSLI
ncbi:hypothetical protein DRO59_06915 [Candidatus Bathyarchaeota archaeon]|nr:MAG: hypothetical protein DRO59_06915 [Candidatus Bathyarchaeota archaeon]